MNTNAYKTRTSNKQNRSSAKTDSRAKTLKIYSIGSVIILIAIVVLLNILVSGLLGDALTFDFSATSQNTISQQTRDFIDSMPENAHVRIVGLLERPADLQNSPYEYIVPLLDDYVKKSDTESIDAASQTLVENAHYVPMATTITVGGKTYNTADMLELALRSYLLLRGYDGNETEKNGFGNIPQVSPVSMSADLPETHKYYYGNYPYAEPSNGGYLRKLDGEKEIFHKVEIRILDNWAQRSLNWAFTNDMVITNFCTYPRADHNITDYKGCFSAMRALITYAHFFKYMLDNNLEKASVSDLGANVEIRSELFGVE